jgi:GNAT superfamily N-acetyltransferase
MRSVPQVADMLSKVRAVQRVYRQEGALVLLWKVSAKLASPIAEISLDLTFDRSIERPLPVPAARAPMSVRLATDADLVSLIPLLAEDEYLSSIDEARTLATHDKDGIGAAILANYRRRIAEGSQAYVGIIDGAIAHLNWLCMHSCDTWPEGRIVLAADEVYTTDAYTLPAFRGLNVHAVVLASMLNEANIMGRRRALTFTNVTRASSYRGLRRLGFVVSGGILYVRWAGSKAGSHMRLWGRTDRYFPAS